MHSRRILGLLIICTALLGVALSIVGIVVGPGAVDRVGDQLDAGLVTAGGTLNNLEQTLELSKSIVDQVMASMNTLERTALYASQAIDETRPLIAGVGQLVRGDIADAIESAHEAVAPLVDLAGTIDEILTTLSEFKIEQSILGIDLSFDLGIEYDPEVSLPRAVNAIADSLAGVPEKLRALSDDIEGADENLGTISEDLALMASDIREISASLAELPPLIDSFQANVISAEIQLNEIQTDLRSSWRLIEAGVFVLFVWLGLTQVAPLLWGYEMCKGRRFGDNRR
jgi:uncharacterized phage infection (PIP) family protein YhgE